MRRNLERTIDFPGPFSVKFTYHDMSSDIKQMKFTVAGETWIVTTHRDGEVIEYDVYDEKGYVRSEIIKEYKKWRTY